MKVKINKTIKHANYQLENNILKLYSAETGIKNVEDNIIEYDTGIFLEYDNNFQPIMLPKSFESLLFLDENRFILNKQNIIIKYKIIEDKEWLQPTFGDELVNIIFIKKETIIEEKNNILFTAEDISNNIDWD